jgi:hypothetical protein
VRALAALLIACVTGIGSCGVTSTIVGSMTRSPAGLELTMWSLAPYLVGTLIAAWSYYLLLVGERDDLKTRRARRAARMRRLPHPLMASALTAVLVVGLPVAFIVALGDLGGWEWLVGTMVLGPAVGFALPMAIVAGVVTARVRARQDADGARNR